jgi:hypothetical protein
VFEMAEGPDLPNSSRAEEEERVRRDQELDLMHVVDVPPSPYEWAHGKVQWLEAEEGVTVKGVELRGTFPDTRLVVVFTVFRDEGYAGCTFRWHFPIWHADGTPHDLETLGVHLVEFLAKRLGRYRGCEPGTTLDVGSVMPPSEYGQ